MPDCALSQQSHHLVLDMVHPTFGKPGSRACPAPAALVPALEVRRCDPKAGHDVSSRTLGPVGHHVPVLETVGQIAGQTSLHIPVHLHLIKSEVGYPRFSSGV